MVALLTSAAAHAVPVNPGWTWSALFSLLQVLVTTVLGGGFLVAWIRTRPALQKIANDREAAQAAIKRDDMDDMRQRISGLEGKVEEATKAAHNAEMRLVHAVAAVQLLAAKIRADNPNDPTLKQAMDLIAAATVGNMKTWSDDLISGLDRMKGVGE